MKRALMFIIYLLAIVIAVQAQSFSNTKTGTVGADTVPTGWSKVGSPDYSSFSVNGYDSTTPWTSTLPAAPR